MKCAKGYEVEVLKSNAGYYIGVKESGEPLCRLSEEYWKTEAEANQHLSDHTYRTRQAVEIIRHGTTISIRERTQQRKLRTGGKTLKTFADWR